MNILWKTILVALSVSVLTWPLITQADSTWEEPPDCPKGTVCLDTTEYEGGTGGTDGNSASAGPGSWDIATETRTCPPDMICAEWFSAAGPDNYMDGDLCCIFLSDMANENSDDDYDDCQILISKRPRGDETAGGNPENPGEGDTGGDGAAL